MVQETNSVRPAAGKPTQIDAVDRKLLSLLAEDATRSYAEMGTILHLSPPAVHERVRRLKRDGVILGTVARLSGAKLGRGLLAFVHIDTTGWGKTEFMLALDQFSEVEEIHSVAGDTSMLIKVRTADTQALEDLLHHIYRLEGVKGTRSYIALSSYLERGPRP